MNKATAVLVCLVLTGCSSAPEVRNEEEIARLEAEEAKEARAEAEATAKLDQVNYPECAVVWKDNKVTACGRAVFKRSMAACRGRALTWSGAHGTPTIIDEYTGDGWQARAGMASKNDEQRIKLMELASTQSPSESVAATLGNNTSDIQIYYCDLDQSFRLTGIQKGRLITNRR